MPSTSSIFTPKLKVEVVVRDDLAEQCLSAVREAAQTGHIGDGKIFVIVGGCGSADPHRGDRRRGYLTPCDADLAGGMP